MRNELSIEQIAQLAKRVKPFLCQNKSVLIMLELEEITDSLLNGSKNSVVLKEYDGLAHVEIICKGKKEADAQDPAYEIISQYEILSQIPERFIKEMIGYLLPEDYVLARGIQKLDGSLRFKMPIYLGTLPEEANLLPMTFCGKKI